MKTHDFFSYSAGKMRKNMTSASQLIQLTVSIL